MDVVRIRAADREHRRPGRVGWKGVVSDVQGRWAQVRSPERRSCLFFVLAPAVRDSATEWVGETHCWGRRSPRTHVPWGAVLYIVSRPYLELVAVVLYMLLLPSDCLVDIHSVTSPIETDGSSVWFVRLLLKSVMWPKLSCFN